MSRVIELHPSLDSSGCLGREIGSRRRTARGHSDGSVKPRFYFRIQLIILTRA